MKSKRSPDMEVTEYYLDDFSMGSSLMDRQHL